MVKRGCGACGGNKSIKINRNDQCPKCKWPLSKRYIYDATDKRNKLWKYCTSKKCSYKKKMP